MGNNIVSQGPPNVKPVAGEPPSGPFVEVNLELRGGRPRALRVKVLGLVADKAETESLASRRDSEISEAFPLTREQRMELRVLLKKLPHDCPSSVRTYLNCVCDPMPR